MTDHTAEPDWLHLKAYGYAPGNYMSRCCHCNGTFAGLDKLANSCRSCAEKIHTRKGAAAPSLTVGDELLTVASIAMAAQVKALPLMLAIKEAGEGDVTLNQKLTMDQALQAIAALAPAAQAEPVAWLITGGRAFKDQVVLLEGTADTRIAERKDGSQKVPLGPLNRSNPPAQGVETMHKAFWAWRPADGNPLDPWAVWRAACEWQARAAIAQAQKEQQP